MRIKKMTRNITMSINCGEKTCASEPGEFCKYAISRVDGFNPTCRLFEKPLKDEGEPTGWLKRCKECMESEK
jgi:hypothetical protein